MKETYYFSHDYNAQQDPKMIELLGECGLEGIGFYWILIEHLHSEPTGKISKLQLKTLLKMYGGFHGGEQKFEQIQQVLNTTHLVVEDENGFVYSERVLNHKKDRESISLSRSKAGKRSAEVRQNLTNVQQNSTNVQQYKGKERKGKEKKENIYNTQIDFFKQCWLLYPRKKGKGAAEAAFKKLKQEVYPKVLDALQGQVKGQLSGELRYVPHFSTWLNERRWEDEIEVDYEKVWDELLRKHKDPLYTRTEFKKLYGEAQYNKLNLELTC